MDIRNFETATTEGVVRVWTFSRTSRSVDGKFGGSGRPSAERRWNRNVGHTSETNTELQPAYAGVRGFGFDH